SNSPVTPVFSPDGSEIAYTSLPDSNRWDMWRVPVLGGQPGLWLPNASGLVWSGTGRILFSIADSVVLTRLRLFRPTHKTRRIVDTSASLVLRDFRVRAQGTCAIDAAVALPVGGNDLVRSFAFFDPLFE